MKTIMQLYIVHNECKGVYSTMEGASECVSEEQSRYPGKWIQYGPTMWQCGTMTISITTPIVKSIKDDSNQLWIVFHGDDSRYMSFFATEDEARLYINPNELTETSHNNWVFEGIRCYIKRFDILDGFPIKEPGENY